MRPSRSLRPAPTSVLLLGILICGGTTAKAQHAPDPFNIVGEYNRQYEPFLKASGIDPDGIAPAPGRQGGAAANRSNRLPSDLEELDTPEAKSAAARGRSPRASARGVPYTRVFRESDEALGRVYRPSEADQKFYSKQQQRDKDYFEALREPDPKLRARLLREFNDESQRSNRGGASSRDANEGAGDRTSDDAGAAMPEELPAALPRGGSARSSALGGRTSASGSRLTSPRSRGSSTIDLDRPSGRAPSDVLRRSRARGDRSTGAAESKDSGMAPSAPR